jgi:CHAT domain-containing protein/Flp pilus assembly protein TadD
MPAIKQVGKKILLLLGPVLVLWLNISGGNGPAFPASDSAIDFEEARTPQEIPGQDPFEVRIKAGRHEELISDSLKAFERDPASASAFDRLLRIMEQSGSAAVDAAVPDVVRVFGKLLAAHPGNARIHYGLGVACMKLGDFGRARAQFEASILSGADFWEVFEDLSNAYLTEADIRKTLVFLEARLGKNTMNPFVHQAIGVLHYYSSEYHEAFVSLEKAREIFRARGLKNEEVKCLLNLSDDFTYLNDYPRALERAMGALRLARALGDKQLEALSLERCAFIWADLGKDSKAYDACTLALSLSRDLASRKLEILCIRTLGVVLLNRGDLRGAEEHLSQALNYYRMTRALRSQDICLYWLTLLLRNRGEYARAMDCAQEALRISRLIGFKTGEAFHLTTIGAIHLSLGNYERALEFNKDALVIAERYVGKWSKEECLNTIGYVYMELQDYDRALASFDEALRYIEKIGHTREKARCLYNLGFAHFKLGDLGNAAACFEKSLLAADLSRNRIVSASIQNRFGDLYLRQGLWDKSEAAYNLAAAAGRSIGQPTVSWEAASGLGALCAARHDVPRAIDHYKDAIAVIEDLRVQLLLREQSSGFFQSKISIYEALVNLLYEAYQARPEEAILEECLFFAEKAKARSFLDDLQKAGVAARVLPREMARQLDLISSSVSRLSSELSSGLTEEADRPEIRRRLERAEDDYEILVAKVGAETPGSALAVSSEPRRLPEIRRTLLDGRTGLIEYFVGDDNMFVFIVTRDRLTVERLVAPESERTLRLAADFVRLLSSKEIIDTDVLPAGRRLYGALIGLADKGILAGLENLIIVPDRSLHYLPFEALVPPDGAGPVSGRAHFLMENYGLSYAPSASTLVSILDRKRSVGARQDLIAIGDPIPGPGQRGPGGPAAGQDMLFEYYRDKRFALFPLKFASREIDAIAGLIDSEFRRTLTRAEATEDRVKRLPLADYKVLHFSTHSLLDEQVAAHSALVLTRDQDSREDGFLQAREIYDLSLKADLVVLSACQTAAGKMEKGEGIQGLARAFFCAGSRSVVASLWNVNDASTARFMRTYYEYLTRGRTKQEALRLTKIKMSRSPGSRPFHWAAFILIGEGGAGVPLHPSPWWRRLLHL